MSFMVARMQKMKAGNLVGIGNHNQRLTDNHSNKDIDVQRSHLNYDLVNRTENYKRDIQQFINDNKSSSRAVRKDAVLVNEWIITSDKDFFKDKDSKEIKDFFEAAKSYFSDKFGDDNIRYAQVHMDETTPHMHLGIVPFNDEYKLSAKTVFNRQALQAVQDELPKHMQDHGFELERGEKGSERKNLSVPEYKQAKDELKEMTEKLSEIEFDDTVERMETKPVAFQKKYVKVLESDLETLKSQASTAKIYESKFKNETKKTTKLQEDITRLRENVTGLNSDISTLTKSLEHKNSLLELADKLLKKLTKRFTEKERGLDDFVDDIVKKYEAKQNKENEESKNRSHSKLSR